MATLLSDGGDADRQRRAQRGVTRLLVRDLRKLRRLIIPSRMQATVPDWIEAVRALVGEYGAASASLAANYYDAQRMAAKVTGTFTVPLLDPPPDEQVDNSLRWATKDLWPRDPEDPATTEAQKAPLETRLEQAEKKAEQVAQKLVADQGRGTVHNAVQRDRQAVGWARSAALGACAFCRMLSIRGMVYKRDTVGFRAHDGCHCMAIPVFKGQRFELSDKAKEWERLYREYAAPYSGDQLRRFRRAIEEHG
ncbi:VG15 protein [Streptomyces malaysiensis]|uniref:VG15 protein n=1 Tax=Streptomyces malaysiensis TaxID=92644 RepID=UPI0036912452